MEEMNDSTSPTTTEVMNKSKTNKSRQLSRMRGQPYTTSTGKPIPAKTAPSNQRVCKCRYDCGKISSDHKLNLFTKFYKLNNKEQGTYLLNRITLLNIGRRRHGTYENPTESRRQTTVSYTIPNETGNHIRICCKTFQNIFCVTSQQLKTIQKKKKMGSLVYDDERGKTEGANKHKFKYTSDERNLIRSHITSFPKEESHYSRRKSSKEYLSPDLNFNKLFISFKEKYPDTRVTYRFYTTVFKKDFKNVSFSKPRTDTCKMCDKLNIMIKASSIPIEKQKASETLQLHLRRAEKAYDLMKADIQQSQLPGSSICALNIDLQQVLFVPTLTHSTMFYSRQLSCYNLCLHNNSNNDSFMCMWDETVSGRGGSEIASCFFKVMSSGFVTNRHIVVWCDNCAAQNKNRMILMTAIYLVAKRYFDVIEFKYLISGHSYMSCDRDFGLIEKRKRTMKAMIPKELEDIVTSARPQNPFKVIEMTEGDFFDFGALAKEFIKTDHLKLSKVSHLRVVSVLPGTVEIKYSHNEIVEWNAFKVIKKGKKISCLPITIGLPRIIQNRQLSDEKKKDLLLMTEFLEPKYRDFYKTICGVGPHHSESEDTDDGY